MIHEPHESARIVTFVVALFTAALVAPAYAAETTPVYDVEISVDLDAGRYSGREVVRYTNRTKGAVDAVFFNLYPNLGATTASERLLTVTSARVGGAAAEYRHEGSGLLVRLGDKLAPGASADVALEFEGRAVRVSPEQSGLGTHVTDQVSIVLTPGERRPRTGAEEAVVAAAAMLVGNPFPVLSVARDEAWRQKVSAGRVAFAEAHSYRIAVTAPEGVDVVASGVEASERASGARVFEGARLRDVALFASRGYERREAAAAGTHLAVVASPGHAAAARHALETLGRAVEFYSETFGPPPFGAITVVEAPLMAGTPSIAYSGVVAVASAYFVDMRGPEAESLPGFIRDTPDLTEGEIEFAVLHETARQWWGEAVGSDPQRAAFLGEGLAIYSAVVAVERLHGADAAADAVEQRMRAPYRVYRMFGGEDASADRRAGEFANYFAYAAIVDAKSGMFVGALRKALGDERFFAALRRFYESGSGHIRRWDDFSAALAASDVTDRLHDRWIEQEHGDEDIGAPEYAVAVDPKVVSEAHEPDAKQRSSVERFGRFIGRKLAWFGKTAAKPF